MGIVSNGRPTIASAAEAAGAVSGLGSGPVTAGAGITAGGALNRGWGLGIIGQLTGDIRG